MSQNDDVSEVDSQFTLCESDADSEQVPTVRCDMCHEMSTWSFLQDFYRRVDVARQYSARLEHDLRQAAMSAQQSDLAITQYEQSLAISHAKLDNERLEHGATQRALDFEQQNHSETAKLFDLAYAAAVESGELVDGLRAQVVELQGGLPPSTVVPTTADMLLELQVSRDELKRLKTSISSQSHLSHNDLQPY